MTTRLPGPGEIQYRELTIDREAMATRAAGDDIPVVLATEARVPRFFGREILSMDRGAVDLSRAVDGLPLLDSHDATRLIGSVVNIRVGPDRKLRGQLRLGNHPDAPWIFQDIRDGHRPNFSIGYQVHEMTLVEQRDDGDVFRADRWELFEASTLAIPADIEAGAYRAAAIDTNTRGTRMSEHEPGPVAVGLNEKMAEAAEISRICAAHGCAERAGDFITSGIGLGAVKSRLFDEAVQRARPVSVPGHLDPSERESGAIAAGFLPTVAALANRRPDEMNGMVRESSNEIAKRLNRQTSGFYLPLDLKIRASVTGNIAGTTSLGGAGVQTTVLSFIDLLRNK
jgi:HK97 family phage prohead protease